jgi:hypothetical protein
MTFSDRLDVTDGKETGLVMAVSEFDSEFVVRLDEFIVYLGGLY